MPIRPTPAEPATKRTLLEAVHASLLLSTLAACSASSDPAEGAASSDPAGGGASGGGVLATGVGGNGGAHQGGSGFGETGGHQGEGGACVAATVEADLLKLPIDIITMVDTSNSMMPAIDSVKEQLNTTFTSILEQSNIDYRVILIAGYAGNGEGITVCIEPPLGGAPCSPLPALPANTMQFYQYPYSMGSGLLPGDIMSHYASPDPLGTAPTGFSAWLRPEAFKVFLVISDTSSTSSDESLGDAFDDMLLTMPYMFGDASKRRYVMHSIVGLAAKPNPTEVYLPAEGIVGATCSSNQDYLQTGPGQPVQRVSLITGGLRFPVCEYPSYNVVFEAIAEGITEYALACEIPIPNTGEVIDPKTLVVEHTPGDSPDSETFTQVPTAADCALGSFYIVDDVVYLCPETCDAVKASPGSLELLHGCEIVPK